MGLLLQPGHAAAANRNEISATLQAVCSGGGDCAAAVKAAITLAKDPRMADVVGTALADAVAAIGAENPDLATTMLLAITDAPESVQVAYQSAVDVVTATVPAAVPAESAPKAP